MNPKQQMREGIRVLLSASSYLANTYGENIDMRPWVSGDHPISIAHWITCQRRFSLTWILRGTPDSPEAQESKKRRLTSVLGRRKQGPAIV